MQLNPRGVITPCYRCRHWLPATPWVDRLLFGHPIIGTCAVKGIPTWKTASCSKWARVKEEA